MRKAAIILYIIGAAFSLLGAASCITVAIMGYCNALPPELIAKILSTLTFLNGNINALYTIFIVVGSIGAVMAFLGFLSLAFKKADGKAYFILMLVLTLVLEFNIFYLIASILGIADNKVYY